MDGIARRCLVIGALLSFSLASGCPPPRRIVSRMASSKSRAPRNVILFGWDGAQRDHVNECLDRGELPTLRRLAETGALVEIEIEGATDTKAGWTQILTGYLPEVTGVFSNACFERIPEGMTIGERLEEEFGADGVVTMAVIGKKGNVDDDPPRKVRVRQGQAGRRRAAGRVAALGGVRYRVVPGKPFFHMSARTDVFENGLELDEAVGTRAIERIEEHRGRRFFLFVHFAEVDHSGHRHGENSKEYNDALISNDTWTGRIIDKVGELGLADRTSFYVTSDHGFDEGARTHRNAPHVFLATNDGRVARNGMRQDIAPTILEAFGLDLARIDPPLDGAPLTGPPAPAKGRADLEVRGGDAVGEGRGREF